MSWLHGVLLWLRALVRRRSVEREMSSEMRFHLDMEIEQNIREGMTPHEARRRALIAFGGVERYKEALRDEWGTRALQDLAADLRYSLRTLRRRPAFAVLAASTVAVGIGATVAVFSLANGILLRPIAGVDRPDELIRVQFRSGIQETGISALNLADLAGATPGLRGLAGRVPRSLHVAAEGASPRELRGELVGGDYFGVLGLEMNRGRFFRPDELDPRSDPRAVVVSDWFWRTVLDSTPDVLGHRLRINAVDFTVIGVAPPGFRGIERVGQIDLWLAYGAYAAIAHNPAARGDRRRGGAFTELVGRLGPGTTPTRAEAELRAAVARLVQEHPEDNAIHAKYIPVVWAGIGLPVRQSGRLRTMVILLGGTAAIVLLIACANVANLLLLRGVSRRGEIAVRRALGATAGRLVRQHAVDGIVLGVLGAAGGVVIAVWLARVLQLPLDAMLLDWRVLGFAVGMALLSGVIFGVIPALAAQRRGFLDGLNASLRAGTAGASRLRSGLTIVQIAGSAALMVTAALFARTVYNLRHVDLGYEPRQLIAFSVDPEPNGYSAERRRLLHQRVLAEVGAIGGVTEVALASAAPFFGDRVGLDLRTADDSTGAPPTEVNVVFVSPRYFETLGVPVLAGRGFSEAEYDPPGARCSVCVGAGSAGGAASAGTSDGIILNRSAARRLFGDANPLGRRLVERRFTYTVIGLVGDTRSLDLRRAPDPIVYQPLGLAWDEDRILILRSARPRGEIEEAVLNLMARVDPALPIPPPHTGLEIIAQEIWEERLFLNVVGALGLLGALLAAVGLYGIVAYTVADRTREIGIRMALGARTAGVVRIVVAQAGRLIAIGLVIGLLAAAGLGRIIRNQLFGVASLDPASYLGTVVFFGLIALMASAVPARAAARVNPVEALRQE